MEAVRRPILQGEYKLLQVIEETSNSTLYLSYSIQAQERRFAIREFVFSGRDDPEKKALVGSYVHDIAQKYMDFVSPCLTCLRNFFVENEYIYFVYDYVPGHRLSELLAMRNGPFPELLALDLAYKIAAAVCHLHQSKPALFFAYFDPSNIIVATNGFVLLTDYGLGRLVVDYDPKDARMGTLGYAAPEQIGPNGIVSKGTDIYNLGALMHQMVTGMDPRANPNMFVPIDEVNPNIGRDYVDIFNTAVKANPLDRFGSMTEMARALGAVCSRRGRTVKTVKRNSMADWIDVLKRPFVGQEVGA